MRIFEKIYSEQMKNINFFQRKTEISFPKTNIISPPKSGAKTLIFDFFEKNRTQKSLFLDLKDLRIPKIDSNELKNFIEKEKIELLGISSFDNSFDIPSVNSCIIHSYKNFKIKNFEVINLLPLDFEEFLLFNDSFENTIEQFNSFLKIGTLPEIILTHPSNRILKTQEILKLQFSNERDFEIFRYMVIKNGYSYSYNQAYKNLKESIKISKDLLYRTIDSFLENNFIFEVSKLDYSNAPKKYYPYDFALRDAIYHEKDLVKTFETMIFLELKKKNYTIYYQDYIDFFIAELNSAIVVIPFATIDIIHIRTKLILKNYSISQLQVVTFGFEYQGEINSINIEALPFWIWALKE